MSQYCFDIINPENEDIDVNALKKFVRNLYVGKGKNKFKNDDEVPYMTLYAKNMRWRIAAYIIAFDIFVVEALPAQILS